MVKYKCSGCAINISKEQFDNYGEICEGCARYDSEDLKVK